jgi:hypothetical protein
MRHSPRLLETDPDGKLTYDAVHGGTEEGFRFRRTQRFAE